MHCAKLFVLALGLQLVACAAGFYLLQGHRSLLTEEDQLIENLSAVLFLGSGLLGLWLLLRSTGQRKIYLLVTALGLIGFLDELSFGERIFGFSMPSVAGVKIDGVHDLVRLPLRPLRQLLLASSSATAVAVLVILVIAAVLLITAVSHRERLRVWAGSIMVHPPYLAWSIFATLIVVAILLDERIIRFRNLVFLEELLEMNAALALLLVSWCTSRAITRPPAEMETGVKNQTAS